MAHLLQPGRKAVMWHESTKSFYEVWVDRPIEPVNHTEYPDAALVIIHSVSQAADVASTLVLNVQHRAPPISLARSIACYIIRHKTHFTWRRIAAAFGNADPKMALSAFNRVSIMLRDETDIRMQVELVIQKVAPELLLNGHIPVASGKTAGVVSAL